MTAWANGLRSWRRRERVLGGYVQIFGMGRFAPIGYLLLAGAAAAYGYAFGLYGEGQLPLFLMPVVGFAAIAIWIMPVVTRPPTVLFNRLFVGFVFALLCWPDYLAIVLPGIPWISAQRLFGIPLMAVLVFCAFGSPNFRARLATISSGSVGVVGLFAIFMVIAALSIGLSADKSYSISRFTVALMSWASVFTAAVFYFAEPKRVRTFSYYLLGIMLYCLAVGLYEAKHSILPWAGHIPWFLAVEDPRVDALLAGTVRAASGIYRVQSKFATSIGFGEFLGLALPFVLHILATTNKVFVRLLIVAMLPAALYIVIRTDSRLAFICFLSTLILYIAFAMLLRWRDRRDSLFAPAIISTYPIFMAGFLVLSVFWRKLHVMIWGGGAAQFSTMARQEQMRRAIPLILNRPLGHGIGRGAATLNYIAPGSDMLTIDSYYLSVGLEYGIVGFLVFYGMFLWAIWRAGSTVFFSKDRDVLFLGAAVISLVNFLISKSIYSEQENHPLAFAILGMIVALLYRSKIAPERRATEGQR